MIYAVWVVAVLYLRRYPVVVAFHLKTIAAMKLACFLNTVIRTVRAENDVSPYIVMVTQNTFQHCRFLLEAARSRRPVNGREIRNIFPFLRLPHDFR